MSVDAAVAREEAQARRQATRSLRSRSRRLPADRQHGIHNIDGISGPQSLRREAASSTTHVNLRGGRSSRQNDPSRNTEYEVRSPAVEHTRPTRRQSSPAHRQSNQQTASFVQQVATDAALEHLKKCAQSCVKRSKKLEPIQDMMLDLRAKLDRAQENLVACARHQSDSMKILRETMSAFGESGIPWQSHSWASFMTEHGRCCENYMEQMNVVRELDRKLCVLEYKRLGLIRSHCNTVAELTEALQPVLSNSSRLQLMRDAETFDETDSSSSGSSKNDPLLLRYWDTAGELGIMRDRLIEMEENYTEELTKRELRIDQEQILTTSDHEFHRSYNESYQQQKDLIAQNELEVDRLRQQCLDAGLDPHIKRRQSSTSSDLPTSSLFSPSPYASSIHRPSGHVHTSSRRIRSLGSSRLSRGRPMSTHESGVMQRVASWVCDIPDRSRSTHESIELTNRPLVYRKADSAPPRMPGIAMRPLSPRGPTRNLTPRPGNASAVAYTRRSGTTLDTSLRSSLRRWSSDPYMYFSNPAIGRIEGPPLSPSLEIAI